MKKIIEEIKNYIFTIKEYRLLTTFIGSLLIFVSVIALVVIPCWQAKVLYDNEASVLEKTQKSWESFAFSHKEYDKDYASLQAEVKAMRQKLPQNLEPGTAMTELQETANSSKVKLKAIQQGIIKDRSLLVTNIDVEARGDFGDVLQFLQRIEEKQLTGLEALSLKSNLQGELILQGKCKSFVWQGKLPIVTKKL